MRICFATHNQNKVRELAKLVADSIEILSLDELGINEEIEETGNSLQANALLKASYVYNNYGIPCFADDTGLEVEALDNAPGIYSARFAGKPVDNERNIDKLLSLLESQSNRVARFRTVVAYIENDNEYFFEGIADGEIIKKRKGVNGFGYDAVFLPTNFDRTFAEMDLDEKNKISHRAKAVKKLIDFLNQRKSK